MATRLFFADAPNALTGTFPTSEQSTVGTPNVVAPNANTLRTMGTLTSTSMVARSFSSTTTVAQQLVFCAFFASPALDVAQQIPPQPLTLNIANRESSATMNLGADLRAVAYAWRPSTGALVGYLTDGQAMVGDAEPSAAISIRVNNASVTSTITVSTAAGDVIICEIWQIFTQGAVSSFDGTTYYGGTTANVTTNTVVTNHASFFELSTSTLTFAQPPVSGSAGIQLAAVTLAGTGAVKVAGAGSISCAPATLGATGTVAVRGTFANTMAAATKAATGTVAGPFTFGTRSVTLSDATLAATGTVKVAGAGSISCAPATLAAVGTVAVAGAGSISCALATLAATGTVRIIGAGSISAAPATFAATGTVAITGNKVQTLGAATVVATGTVTGAGSAPVGTRNVTLDPATVSASGTLGPAPPVPAPVLPTSTSGGSGASSRNRKKFVVPDLSVEPVKTLNDILGIEEEPASEPVPSRPRKSVKAAPLTEAVAASPPVIAQNLSLPKPSPVVDEEEYSDEDLMYLLLMVTP